MKKETLEEAAEQYYNNNIFCDGITDFEHSVAIRSYIAGASWQAERMYSEEDMIEFNEWSETSKESADFWRKNRRTPTMDDSYNLYMREKRVELFKIWKEQHKKK